MKFYYLGNFDSNGKSELINTDPPADQWVSDYTTAINSFFPEGYKLHHTHPEWLMDNTIDIQSDCEVVITFVKEGAGYRNSFGYFIYPTANPPETIAHIQECYFIFPNASMVNSGGSLSPGDRIKLAATFNKSTVNGKDIVTPNSYTFHNGKSIGFILYPNGWNGSDVNRYIIPYTSISKHNPEKAPELKFHTASFLIPNTNRLVLGIEDLRRDTSSCDHDFNDLIVIIDTDLTAVTKRFVDTKEIDDEKNDPNVPNDYTLGYKKIYSSISGTLVECVATLYIPRTSLVKMKKDYGARMMTDRAYVKNILVVAPKTRSVNTTRYIGTFVQSGFSWYNNSFIYTVGSYVNETVDVDAKTGIHFFRDCTEAADYDYSPTYFK
jgi:hypothetical protein